MDLGAAASIPHEKGEGAGEIYFFQLLHLSPLSLSAFCGDSSVELVAVNRRSSSQRLRPDNNAVIIHICGASIVFSVY